MEYEVVKKYLNLKVSLLFSHTNSQQYPDAQVLTLICLCDRSHSPKEPLIHCLDSSLLDVNRKMDKYIGQIDLKVKKYKKLIMGLLHRPKQMGVFKGGIIYAFEKRWNMNRNEYRIGTLHTQNISQYVGTYGKK